MIRTENLSVVYRGGIVALHPLSLNLNEGEFTVLLGSSGAGKSTLLKCLNGLAKPTQGNVVAEGLGDLKDPKVLREHRKRTGTIYQQHQLIPRQTALKNVLISRVAYHSTWRSFWPLPKKDHYIALECLDRVGLLDKALVRVDRLSGGQQQRVGISRALAQQPRMVLADEPVASLDPTSSHYVLSLLRKICKNDGISAVVSLHQVELATEYADRIVGISEGQIVFDGTPAAAAQKIDQIYSTGVTETNAT